MNSNKKTYHRNIKISLYWKCQLLGWGLVSLFWLYLALVRDQFAFINALVNYFLDIILCIGITHIYRSYALRFNWNELDINQLLVRAIPSIFLLSVAFMQVMNLKMSLYVFLFNDRSLFLENLFNWNPVLITGLRHMSIWVLAYHLYHFYIKEVNTARTNAQLSIIAKQAQLDNLSTQLNPHFLFNSLNSIKSLIIENPKIARRAVDLLSELLRSSLYEKDNFLTTISEELSLVNDYVELEKLRFEERLNIAIEAENALKNLKIPTFCIQLLVENAIKHGIDKIIEGGLVTIKITKSKNQIHIQVQNPGKLALNGSPNGLGLRNLNERLKIQYKNQAFFRLVELENNTVEATIILPIATNENI
jgi:hypothetical protein